MSPVLSRGWSRLRESDKLLRVSYATFTPPVVYILTSLPRAIWLSPGDDYPHSTILPKSEISYTSQLILWYFIAFTDILILLT